MVTSAQVAERYRKQLMKRCTPEERKMKAVLKSLGYKYKFQFVIPNTTSFYIVDFLVQPNIVIECDGDYHTYNLAQREWDKKRDEYLSSLNMTVIRVNNHALAYPAECKRTEKWLGKQLEKIRNRQTKLG